MNIYFRHGPFDGKRKFYHLDSNIIIVETANETTHYYLRTPRIVDGARVYQHLGEVPLEVKQSA